MKRSALILLACLSGAAVLGSGNARAATTVTCGDEITSSGTYNLAASCSGDGIAILASHVTLNLNGHTMTGPGEDGIFASSASAIGIVGPGTIAGYGFGIEWDFISRSHITHVTVTNSTAHGIGFLDSSDNQLISDSVTGSTFHGITFNGCNGNLISGVTSTGNGDNGLYLASSGGNRVLRSTFDANGLDGIAVGTVGNGPANKNEILENTANDNATYGIAVNGDVTGSYVYANSAHGNFVDDLADLSDVCSTGTWLKNKFGTANDGCIH